MIICPRCEGTGVYNFRHCALCTGSGRLNEEGEAYCDMRTLPLSSDGVFITPGMTVYREGTSKIVTGVCVGAFIAAYDGLFDSEAKYVAAAFSSKLA